MKPWQLNRKIKCLSHRIDDPARTETRFDINCFSEPERKLLDRVQEIVDKYAPASPPQDVIENNSDLWYKGLEIFGRRATELFVDVVPDSFCCDELEEWYFKVYFYNFWLDWMESIKELPQNAKEATRSASFGTPRNGPAGQGVSTSEANLKQSGSRK